MPLTFLPATREEFQRLNWSEADVVLVTGDAYVDHPSFGAAVIGRVLEREGCRVAVLPMPPWRRGGAVTIFGKPRLFFGVTSGNVDSMLARRTAFGKVRNDDPYSPSGLGGMKPARAVIVYCNMVRAAFRDVPIVIGGIEASMRRFAHYDFWDNRVRRSIVQDARADILVYGPGERQIVEIARRLRDGQSLVGIPGTVVTQDSAPADALLLPSEEEVCADKGAYLRYYGLFHSNQHLVLAQPAGRRYIVQYPAPLATGDELDRVFELPFARKPHPVYGSAPIPAFEMIRASVTAHRGCVSGCAFCSLGLHQGKRIVARSAASVCEEVKRVAAAGGFRGHITDIGGPSANMYGTRCASGWRCDRASCTFPDLCPRLGINTSAWMGLLDRAGAVRGVKHVTVGSGIRYDLFMIDDVSLLKPLLDSHVSGQLKVAPEHTSPRVLRAMGKTHLYPLEEFAGRFAGTAKSLRRRLYLVPYLMSCHPGCSLHDMRSLRRDALSIFRYVPDQVQAFVPLPLTLSSAMYHTGVNPLTGEELFVERSPSGRRRQHRALGAPVASRRE